MSATSEGLRSYTVMSIQGCLFYLFVVFGLACTVEGATFPIEETTIAQLQTAYRAGKTTAREVTQAYLDRVASYDRRGPYLNSLITVNAHALADAAKLDATLKSTGKLVGPLHGIPVIVKEQVNSLSGRRLNGTRRLRNARLPRKFDINDRCEREPIAMTLPYPRPHFFECARLDPAVERFQWRMSPQQQSMPPWRST